VVPPVHAPLYAARANLEPLVIEGFNWGGQLMITSDVENYPGYADGVLGPAMMQDFRRQAERFGTTFLTDDVHARRLLGAARSRVVGDDEYRAESVIVATGATARQLGLESERDPPGARRLVLRAHATRRSSATRRSWSSEAATRRWRRRTSSLRFASKVILGPRREEFAPSPIMVDPRSREREIELVLNKVVEGGARRGLGDRCPPARHGHGEESVLETDGLFVAIGHDPNTALFLDQLDHEPETGYLVTPASRRRRTSMASSPPVTSRPRVPPGRDGRRLRLRGRARRGALAERAAPRGVIRAVAGAR
jgi:thioredoxin reductase (NADPH)